MGRARRGRQAIHHWPELHPMDATIYRQGRESRLQHAASHVMYDSHPYWARAALFQGGPYWSA